MRAVLITLKYGIINKKLLTSIIGITFLMLVAKLPDINYVRMNPKLLDMISEISGLHSYVGIVALSLFVWAYGLDYLDEFNSGFFVHNVHRIGMKKYCISKCVTCVLISFISVALSYFLVSLFLFFMGVRGLYNDTAEYAKGSLEYIYSKNYFGYYLLVVMQRSLEGSALGMVAMTISTKIKNPFVIISIPILISLVFNNYIYRLNLPRILMPSFLYYGPYQYIDRDNIYYEFLVSIGMTLLLVIILSVVFYYNAKGELEDA